MSRRRTQPEEQRPAFMINSNERYGSGGSWREMLTEGIVCTSGDIKYGSYLRRLKRGSRLFLYVNQVGVVAEGIVESEWSGRPNKPSVVWKGRTEYSVGVTWIKQATERQAVPLAELKRMGVTQYHITLSSLSLGVADEISAQLPGGASQEPRGRAGKHVWIFQANPDSFDIDGYLSAETDITWTVRQKQAPGLILPGDLAYLWRASGSKTKAVAGIVASAVVVEAPRVRTDDEASLPFWRNPSDAKPALRARLQVTRVANKKQVVQRDWLKDDPVVHGMRILRFANETNYLLEAAEAERISALWTNTGRHWNRAESIAGLWAYLRTQGKQVSKSPGSPVAEVAALIGRACSGVYNKVMNFRSLDPGDERSGLPGVGESDREAWKEFFDVHTKQIRRGRLEAEFKRLWIDRDIAGPDREPDSGETMVADPVDRRPGGQGRRLDVPSRKAIERRAMEMAIAYYEGLGFTVRDTSAKHPYDLLCMKDAQEVRVEVKGTTGRGDSVTITSAELKNARGTNWRTDLLVVFGIALEGAGLEVRASGGEQRLVEGWSPDEADLRPLTYECKVIEGA